MLNISLSALLIALGVYLGFIWKRDLGANAGLHDSRNVFIFYIIGVFSMIAVYSVLNALKDSEDKHQEVRKELFNLLEQVQIKTGKLPARSTEGLIGQEGGKEDKAKGLDGGRTVGDRALLDLDKVLEESIRAQEALLKANSELLAKIRGTSRSSII